MLMLPDNHSIINKDNLVAEAQGLLDRLLDVFTDDSR